MSSIRPKTPARVSAGWRARLAVALIVTCGFAWAGAVGSATAAVLRVPSEFATIQAAIDAAAPSDVVIVAPGSYRETLDYLGKDIAVISAKGPDVTVIQGPADTALVTFHAGETEAAILDGFTLTGGIGTPTGHDRNGGAIFCKNASPTIVGCRFVENRGAALTLGGAIFVLGDASPRIEDCEFLDNEARVRGSAIDARLGPSLTVVGCTFRQNSHLTVLSATDADLTLLDCVFEDNRTNPLYATTLSDRGPRHVRIERSRFLDNDFGGVAVYLTEPGSTAVIAENLHEGNGSGGLAVNVPDALIERNRVTGNSTISGFALNNVVGGHARFVGNVIAGNAATGPAIDVFETASATFLHDTIVDNGGPAELATTTSGSVEVVNSIVWTPSGSLFEGEAPTFTRCLLSETAPLGEENLVADPLLVDLDDDPHLRLESLAVDAAADVEGLPAVDIDGDSRILAGAPGADPRPDIGADELRPETAARFGTVDAGTPNAIADVLLANGSAGDRTTREIALAAGEALRVDMVAPPAGPATAPFALYAWSGEPTIDTITMQPFGLGWTGFATPLQGGSPLAIWNNLGRFGSLGAPTRPSTPAPSRVLNVPSGLPLGTVVTLQGYIADDGSAVTRGPASVTNAVVLRAET